MIIKKNIPAGVYEDNTNDPYEAEANVVAYRYLITQPLSKEVY